MRGTADLHERSTVVRGRSASRLPVGSLFGSRPPSAHPSMAVSFRQATLPSANLVPRTAHETASTVLGPGGAVASAHDVVDNQGGPDRAVRSVSPDDHLVAVPSAGMVRRGDTQSPHALLPKQLA